VKQPLRIAITADLTIPVPPQFYGGIERIIDMLINTYTERGHEVSLFAHRDSKTTAKLIPYRSSSHNRIEFLKNCMMVNSTILRGNFDVVHSFGRLALLLPILPTNIPKVMSYQREPTLRQIRKAMKITKHGSIAFTGCSRYISDQILQVAPAYSIFNGVKMGTYGFQPDVPPQAPLVFLGRIEPIKGTHIAIEMARTTGRKLIIAGNIPSEHQSYFDNLVKPFLDDQVTYIGPVNDEQKNQLLGSALALLMPVQWNEPFGIVMAEAMACGTPVIGFNRGALPEIIINGFNGFCCNSMNDMETAIGEIENIDRHQVRKDALSRFSADVIADQYLNIYHQLINKK